MPADAIVRERAAFGRTLGAVGPGAPTLVEGWSAFDVAAHVVSLDRLAGVPTFVGRSIVGRGVRLNDVAGRFADRGLEPVRRRGFGRVVESLQRRPPALLLRPSVAAVGLFEVYVHHEDVRRPNDVERAVPAPRDALTAVVPWLLRYHRGVLGDVRLSILTPHGEWRAGAGAEVIVEGPIEEVVLRLAGRPDAAVSCSDASILQRLRI